VTGSELGVLAIGMENPMNLDAWDTKRGDWFRWRGLMRRRGVCRNTGN